MARPIAETPILYGEDAVRFEELIKESGKFDAEEFERIEESYKEFCKKVKVLI